MKPISLPIVLTVLVLASQGFLRAEEKDNDPRVVKLKAAGAELERLSRDSKFAEAMTVAEDIVKLSIDAYGEGSAQHASALYDLAWLFERTGDFAKAEPISLRALEMREKLNPPDPRTVYISLSSLAETYILNRAFEKAEALLVRGVALFEKTPEASVFLAAAQNCLGVLYFKTDDFAKAEKQFSQSLQIREKQPDADAGDLAESLVNLAETYRQLNEPEKAEPLYLRCVTASEKTGNGEMLARSLLKLGRHFYQLRRDAEAVPVLLRSLENYDKFPTGNGLNIAEVAFMLAAATFNEAPDKAVEYYKRSLELREKELGPEHLDVAEILNRLGVIHGEKGKFEEALAYLERALAIRRKNLDAAHPDIVTTMSNMASFYMKSGKFSEAAAYSEVAVGLLEKAPTPNDDAMLNLSLIQLKSLLRTESLKEAIPPLKRALALQEKKLGPDEPVLAETLFSLGAVLLKTGESKEAEPLFVRALAIIEKAYGPNHQLVLMALEPLADAYAANGNQEKAAEIQTRIKALREKQNEK